MPNIGDGGTHELTLGFSETLARAERVFQRGLQCVARTDRRIHESLSIVRHSALLTGVEHRNSEFSGELA